MRVRYTPVTGPEMGRMCDAHPEGDAGHSGTSIGHHSHKRGTASRNSSPSAERPTQPSSPHPENARLKA
ncbi:hypothetical protein [uncultured Hyphomonas sp.]|uniref:hypothetical protein n=1 Tax=uncultured Hyphomonas sp. TaxID=225298 RepID=UPI0037486BCF